MTPCYAYYGLLTDKIKLIMEIIGIALVCYSLLGAWYFWSENKFMRAEKRQVDWVRKMDSRTQSEIDEIIKNAKSCTTLDSSLNNWDTTNITEVFMNTKTQY